MTTKTIIAPEKIEEARREILSHEVDPSYSGRKPASSPEKIGYKIENFYLQPINDESLGLFATMEAVATGKTCDARIWIDHYSKRMFAMIFSDDGTIKTAYLNPRKNSVDELKK